MEMVEWMMVFYIALTCAWIGITQSRLKVMAELLRQHEENHDMQFDNNERFMEMFDVLKAKIDGKPTNPEDVEKHGNN